MNSILDAPRDHAPTSDAALSCISSHLERVLTFQEALALFRDECLEVETKLRLVLPPLRGAEPPALDRSRGIEFASSPNTPSSGRSLVPTEVEVMEDASEVNDRRSELTRYDSQFSLGIAHIRKVWSGDAVREATPAQLLVSRRMAIVNNPSPRQGDVTWDENRLLRCLVHKPTSRRRICWDAALAVVLLYDIWSLPLMVFDWEGTPLGFNIAGGTTSFWAADFVVSLFSGYVVGGMLEMRVRHVMLKYMCGWGLLDLSVLTADIAFLITTPRGWGLQRYARLSKVMRLVRVIRLARFGRVFRLLRKVENMSQITVSRTVATVLTILKMLMSLAFVNHFVACSWLGVGFSEQSAHGESWLDKMDESANNYHMYVVAFHWSITQFTPAPNNYHPKTMMETLFTVVVLFFGLATYSFFLGSITGAIVSAQRDAAARVKQDEALQRYLCENAATLDVSNLIVKFVREQRCACTPLTEEDVDLLQDLPPSLRLQLRYEVRKQHVEPHPLFRELNIVFPDLVAEVCDGSRERLFMPSQELFQHGDAAEKMWFTNRSETLFYDSDRCSLRLQDTGMKVSWICEGALWYHFLHVETLSTENALFAVEVEFKNFSNAVLRHRDAAEPLVVYARRFVDIISGLEVTGEKCCVTMGGDLTCEQIEGLTRSVFYRRRRTFVINYSVPRAWHRMQNHQMWTQAGSVFCAVFGARPSRPSGV